MKGFSQEIFAEKVGVSPQEVSKWENDIIVPSSSELAEIERIFGVDITNFTDNSILYKKTKKKFYEEKTFLIIGIVIGYLVYTIGMTYSEVSSIVLVFGILGMVLMNYSIFKLIGVFME